jgi:hypothetical protein
MFQYFSCTNLGFNQTGNALLAVLLALGIGGIVAKMISTTSVQGLKSQKLVEIKHDKIRARVYLTQRVACTDTWVGCGTTVESPVDIFDGNAAMVAASTGQTKFGRLNIRAMCKEDTSGSQILRFEYGRLDSSGNALENPLVAGKFDTFSSLFPPGAGPCADPAGADEPVLSIIDICVAFGGTYDPATKKCNLPFMGNPAVPAAPSGTIVAACNYSLLNSTCSGGATPPNNCPAGTVMVKYVKSLLNGKFKCAVI